MVTGEVDGFKYKVDETLIDDMEFLELFAASEDEDPFAFFKAIKTMFPGEEKKRLYDHVRDPKTKRVPSTKVGKLIGAIIADARESGKNS